MGKTALDLDIDLEDGAGITRVTSLAKPRISERLPQRFMEPLRLQITTTPVSVVISVAHVVCLACGHEHRDHRGIFIENRLTGGGGGTVFKRITLRELGPFMKLPRRVDIAPREAVPICSDCWLHEQAFREAVAVAQASGDLFGDVGESKGIAEIAHELKELKDSDEIEIDIDPEERMN